MKSVQYQIIALLCLCLFIGCKEEVSGVSGGDNSYKVPASLPVDDQVGDGASPSSPGVGDQGPVDNGDQQPDLGPPVDVEPVKIYTNLVESFDYQISISDSSIQLDLSLLEKDYLACGVSSMLTPDCRDNRLDYAFREVNMSASDGFWIEGRVARFRKSKRTIALFQIKNKQLGTEAKSRVGLYLLEEDTTRPLGEIVSLFTGKLEQVEADDRIQLLEQTLGLQEAAVIEQRIFSGLNEFIKEYESVTNARKFYHWSQTAFSMELQDKRIKDHYEKTFSGLLGQSQLAYWKHIAYQGVRSSFYLGFSEKVFQSYENSYYLNSDRTKQGVLAICHLSMAPVGRDKKKFYAIAKEETLSRRDLSWTLLGIRLYHKFGEKFGRIEELEPFSRDIDPFVRAEVAASISPFSHTNLFVEIILRLNTDSTQQVQDIAYSVVSNSDITVRDFNVSDLIRPGDTQSGKGLARALAHVDGQPAYEALLRLAVDTNYTVRETALSSIEKKKINIGNFDVRGLIDDASYSSRENLAYALKNVDGVGAYIALLVLVVDDLSFVGKAALSSLEGRSINIGPFNLLSLMEDLGFSASISLAKALKFVTGESVGPALLNLASAGYSSIRNEALKTLSGKSLDIGTFDIFSLIDQNDGLPRSDLAKALKFFHGSRTFEALLTLSSDGSYRVREEALKSLGKRRANIGSFNIVKLINNDDSRSREGLARALKNYDGVSANQVLLRLNADESYLVGDAAFASIDRRKLKVGSLDIKTLINKESFRARTGLAKALEFAFGAHVIDTLVLLSNDSSYYVQQAAQASLRARGY